MGRRVYLLARGVPRCPENEFFLLLFQAVADSISYKPVRDGMIVGQSSNNFIFSLFH